VYHFLEILMRVSALINKKKLDDNHQRENVLNVATKKEKTVTRIKRYHVSCMATTWKLLNQVPSTLETWFRDEVSPSVQKPSLFLTNKRSSPRL